MWRGILLVIVLLLLEYIVLPQMSEALDALRSLTGISLPLVLLGLALEVVSLLALGALTWTIIGVGSRPSYFAVLRVDLTDLGVNNVVPGGGLTSLVVRYRLLTLTGVPASDVLSSAGIEITVSNLVLGGIFGLAALFSLPSIGQNPYYLLAGLVVLAILVIATIGSVLLLRHRDRSLWLVEALGRRFPSLPQEAVASFIGLVTGHLAVFMADPRRLLIATIWASANWLLDAASLWVFLLAFGWRFDIAQLLLAYGLASILGLLPISPGGLGIVEGILVPVLVGFASPHPIVVLGVVAWRLVEHWLPIPVAALAYLSLRLGVLRTRREPSLELKRGKQARSV